MPTISKILAYVLSGLRDNNIAFYDLQRLLDSLGFKCRVKGSHYIYSHELVTEIINIQRKGNNAKAYQVQQIRNIILKYKLNKSIS